MLDAERLIDSARVRSGVPDRSDPTWRPGLEVLVESLNREARLTEVGELVLGEQIVKSLANRFAVSSWLTEHPAVAGEVVRGPVFILGLPRTGTTLLSYLLDRDQANRSLLRWEAFESVPPPGPGDLRSDPRVAVAAAEQEALYAAAPGFQAIHHEEADGPTECITVLGQDLRSPHFETLAHVPSYGRWCLEADLAPAYTWHRTILQVLQSGAPGRWCLKSPIHNLFLDELVATYPDARFIFTHRDPVPVVASLCKLVSVLVGLSTDEDFDTEIGARWLDLVALCVERSTAFRAAGHEHRFLDLSYESLARAPLATLELVYDWLGWPLDAPTRTSAEEHLAANPKGRFGTHRYSLDPFGLTPRLVETRLGAYRERFVVGGRDDLTR